MIRGLILYYLNIKETHGYEIQRFIQLSGIDSWAKIQSGSIYYALAKLEKEENIRIVAEEGIGQRERKIYGITEKGKKTLHTEMLKELNVPITTVGSSKYIVEPMLATLNKEEIQSVVEHHIEGLKQQLQYWKEWKKTKADDSGNKLMTLSFEITIRSLSDQIEWHEELLRHLEQYMEQSQSLKQCIQSFDADRFERFNNITSAVNSIDFAQKLKEKIQKNPELAIQDLDRIIEELKESK